MNKCIKCGSYAFNLYKEGIDQGGLCDVHYWQGRAHRAEALMSVPDDAQPEPSPEWMTEEEQTAYTFGWFKALESKRMAQPAVAEQHKQEPVAHTAIFHCPNCEYPHRQVTHITGVAQPPWLPQRTAAEGEDNKTWVNATPWRGLTEEEVIDLWPDLIMHRHTYQFWQNLEAKLKAKNERKEKNTRNGGCL